MVAFIAVLTLGLSSKVKAADESVATFELGANGSASHADGSEKTSYTATVDGYTLSLTGGSKMYTGARDAKGNSCIKLGTSSTVGKFTFIVPLDITSVIIKAAKYKSNTTKLSVNNTTYTLTKNSNDGNYDEIVVDTSTNKTVSVTTVSGGVRCMVNSIAFVKNTEQSGPDYSAFLENLNSVDSYMSLAYEYTIDVEEVEVPAESTLSFNNVSNRTQFTDNIQVWKDNGLTLTNNKASSTNAVGNYYNPARFYKNSEVIIESENQFSTLILDSSSSSDYLNPLKTSLTNAGAQYEVESNVITITFAEPVSSFEFVTAGQVRLNSITTVGEDGTKLGNVYSNVNFRIKCAVDSSVKELADLPEGSEYCWGIQVKTADKSKEYNLEDNSTIMNSDANKEYVIINLGDVLNDKSRLSAEFTVRAYVVVDDMTCYSELEKTYSVVDLVKAYYEMDDYKDVVTPLVEVLTSMGYNFE